ncbi:MAG: sugar ABC transporter permease [Oscillospiraceae bacterium]|nr:sugar ABC transporter permease [Oscillospiraceae bacterium]
MTKKRRTRGGPAAVGRYWPVFLLPTAAAFAIGFLWPFLQGIYLSFCRFTTTSNATFVGKENYTAAVSDPTFIHSFRLTALFAVVVLAAVNLIAFWVAYVLTQGIRGTGLFRTVFFMPNLIGGIVLGYIWSVLFDGILRVYHTSILLDGRFGFWGLVILQCWQQIGYMMIIYIAGLQSVPESMLEAARMDGASRWQTLVRVTIPNLMGAITICLFLTLTNSFKLFDQNLALTGGAPILFEAGADGTLRTIRSTEMLALNIYNTFYDQGSAARGVGQAKAVIFFLLVAVISLLQLRATRRGEVDQ